MAISEQEAPAVRMRGATRRSPRLTRTTTARRRIVADRIASWAVTAGGLAIIVSILGILVFILVEVWPLTRPARVAVSEARAVDHGGFAALVSDEHRTHLAGLAADGTLEVVRLADSEVIASEALKLSGSARSPLPLVVQNPPGDFSLAAATRDGRVALVPIAYDVTFEGDRRKVSPRFRTPVVLTLDPAGGPIDVFAARLDDDGGAFAAAALAGGRLAVARRAVTETFTGDVREELSRFEVDLPGPLSVLIVDHDLRSLYGGTPSGDLLWWDLDDGEPVNLRLVSAGPSAVTALSLLIGDRSLVVGQEDGSLSVWLLVRDDEAGTAGLARARDFPSLGSAVARIAPSMRDKGFVAAARGGEAGLYYSTSHRTLWTGRTPVAPVEALFFSPKSDAAYLAGAARLAVLDIHNPHPETTWKTLFGKVWFEGYSKPEYVWQSTGGTDDFEPKLSLTPLLMGTLKGTFYSLILAIPLGVLGAMYLSQLMHPTYKRYVKPVIEIMAALPSVVLGFLAGLWLAPRVEKAVPGIALMLIVLPALVLGAGALWHALPKGFRERFPSGTEAFLFLVVLAGGLWFCFEASPWVERAVFGGNFQQWLLATTGLPYDQRNAIVVGLAMGFAVIPIIFAIAEDAFSNVPRDLVAGSLALSATRWQTTTRVVLPTASPGIFSAIMVGFGRAVGETMIVLMATGNTPIMEWNPFNGFRTLSANIAVEIPEAPHGGTLYRTLFLAALLLFILTFFVNTVAEVVRQRLRERYSQL